jgi:hypothetical protein
MKIFLLALTFISWAFPPKNSCGPRLKLEWTAYQPANLKASKLFNTDEVLNIKLSGSLREIFSDRAEKVKYHPISFSYAAIDSSEVTISAEAKTRGHFRKTAGTCLYPPLMLRFVKNEKFRSSIFSDQSKLKLVMPCQGDEYVVREWMVYRLYNLVTAKSFRARLVRVQLEDAKKKKKPTPFYGILLEEEQQLAKRNHSVLIDKNLIKPQQIEETNFLTMAVFEYLIGNTDWSIQYQQNVKLLLQDSAALPAAVPYDFDHSGLVNAPYAKPAEQLQMYSVVERRYRGYCIPNTTRFAEVFSVFKRLKKDIYNLYSDCPLLDAGYIKATKKYLDEFYSTINNGKAMQKEFSYPCDENGTGNIVIKGLRKD